MNEPPDPGPVVDLIEDAADWRAALGDPAPLVETAAARALAAVEPGRRFELCVVLADDARVRALNARYRGRDAPTNVLVFASRDDSGAPPAQGCEHLGDLVLAFETVAREAAAQGKPLPAHLSHLIVHGTLHALGFDHECSGDAAEMEDLEVRILAGLGVGDPYAAERGEAQPGLRPESGDERGFSQ